MSHAEDCPHEHHEDRVYLTITPSGLRLNVLGLVGDLHQLLHTGNHIGALELVDQAGQMLAAAYGGRFDLLDESYANAVVDRFNAELDNPEALAALEKKEDESE